VLNGSSPVPTIAIKKLSTVVSREVARLGSLLNREVSAEGVQVLIPVLPKRSSNGSGSVSALGPGSGAD
jgi:hypothetical protein